MPLPQLGFAFSKAADLLLDLFAFSQVVIPALVAGT